MPTITPTRSSFFALKLKFFHVSSVFFKRPPRSGAILATGAGSTLAFNAKVPPWA